MGVATTLTNLGVLLWETGRLPEALERLLDALALQRELGLRAVEGATLGNIGVVHWFLGNFARAVEFNQRALEIHREVGDRVGEAMNLNNLASAYRRMGRFTEAAECSRAELASARARGNRDGEAAALTGLGQVSVLSGAPEAEELLVAALALHRETGSAAGEAEVRAELGRLRGDLAEVERALAAARGLGARPLETTALIESARVLLARGDVEGAAERAREAFGAAERIGDRFEQARALEVVARAGGGEGWDEVVRRYVEMGVPVPAR